MATAAPLAGLSQGAGDSGAPGNSGSTVLSGPKGQRGEPCQAMAFLANVSLSILKLAGERVAFKPP